MGYKEQRWFQLKRNGIKFEMIVRDQDFRRIETRRFTPHDFTKTMNDFGRRYGIDKKTLNPNKEIQDEMDWLKKESIIN